MLPRATVTLPTGEPFTVLLRHSENGNASASAQLTCAIGVPFTGSASAAPLWSFNRTAVSMTAQRRAGSASSATPVPGPSTSSKTRMVPGVRLARVSVVGSFGVRVAEVAPAGRQQFSSPHV